MSPLLVALNVEARWLFEELGAALVGDTYDAKHFGNCVVELRIPPLLVAFYQDRGQVSVVLREPVVEPSRAWGHWWEMEFVLEAIGRNTVPALDLDGVLSVFRAEFPALAEAFGANWATTKHRLADLEERRRIRMNSTSGTSSARDRSD